MTFLVFFLSEHVAFDLHSDICLFGSHGRKLTLQQGAGRSSFKQTYTNKQLFAGPLVIKMC